jgi:hypothetical protein
MYSRGKSKVKSQNSKTQFKSKNYKERVWKILPILPIFQSSDILDKEGTTG